MKIIKHDLSKEFKTLELHIFADEHVGDPLHNFKNLMARIEHVAQTPNAFALLNGDLMNNALANSRSDVYQELIPPGEQLDQLAAHFKPIADKILTITPGNHEARTYRSDGIDVSAILASKLNLTKLYAPTGALVFLRFGNTNKNRPQTYSIYMKHGTGGGKKPGGKLNRLVDMAATVDADIYIHSHTHEPMVYKCGFYRVSQPTSSVYKAQRLFVNSSANLEFGGYAETGEFSPSAIAHPIIYLAGNQKQMEAKL